MIYTHKDSQLIRCLPGFHCVEIRRCYHVIEEVDGPVEGLADACDVLQPLGATVVLTDFVDGETCSGDGVTRQHAHSHKDVEHSLNTAGRK